MNWSYIAGFFDGEGNLHLNFVKNKTYLQLVCRIYSSDKKVLEKIKKFVGSGQIYEKKKPNLSTVYELLFSKKLNVLFFLKNILPHLIIKKEHVNYVLSKYNFERGTNKDFDISEFRSFISRKNVDKFHKNYFLNKPLTE